MTELPSPSPYAYLNALPPAERLAARRLQEHRRNAESGSVIDTARRARDLQAELAEANKRATKLIHHGTDLQFLLDCTCRERDSLRTMCAELIEALQPMENEAKRYERLVLGQDIDGWKITNTELTMGDLRKSAATLTRARKLLGGGE